MHKHILYTKNSNLCTDMQKPFKLRIKKNNKNHKKSKLAEKILQIFKMHKNVSLKNYCYFTNCYVAQTSFL